MSYFPSKFSSVDGEKNDKFCCMINSKLEMQLPNITSVTLLVSSRLCVTHVWSAITYQNPENGTTLDTSTEFINL